ncbi:MAG TPA: hypothetical protein VF366_07410 [Dehalococcoidia bacterium]|jgi:hypothetical protein
MKKLLLPVVLILLVTVGCLIPTTTKMPPTAYIDSIYPINVTCGETVTFKGHGIDPDGTVGAYDWRSSRDGDLSTIDTFSTSSLSSGTHTIWLRVQDNDGQWSNQVSGTVVVAAVGETKPVINSFSASPATIGPGQSSVLSWDVTGCTTVNIDQSIGNVALSGTRVVSPTKNTTYTLTAVNDLGTSVATTQVIFSQTPTTKLVLPSIAEEDGQVRRDGYVSNVPLVGDTKSGTAIQAFFSFDISMIPQGTAIESVSLDLPASDLFGSPFEVLGRLFIYEYEYTQLTSKDFASGMAMPGSLYSSNGLITGSISPDTLLSAVQAKIDEGSSRFQIRVQFEKQQIYRGSGAQTYNDLADFIAFDPARTKLTIEYQY